MCGKAERPVHVYPGELKGDTTPVFKHMDGYQVEDEAGLSVAPRGRIRIYR